MSVKASACVECGEPVPYGRLSCPSCGALLASVTGPRRPSSRRAHPAPEPGPTDPEEATAVVADVADDAPPGDLPSDLSGEPSATLEPSQDHGSVAVTTVQGAPRAPDDHPEPEPILIARAYERQAGPQVAPSIRPTTPGAYLPPVPSSWAAGAAPAGLARPSSPIVDPALDARPPSPADGPSSSAPGMVDGARFVEIGGWFVIVGATMSALGFLLPWSRTVIGSSGIGGYFNSWGLASPTHLLVLIGLLVVLALAVLRPPVPAWFRSGVLGLAIGGLLLGLTWPYLVGSLGAEVGVTVTVIGGLALVMGGGVASWATRHAVAGPAV